MGVVLSISRSCAVMEVKNDELTKRVKKHNCLVARTYRLEQNVAVIRRDVESLDEKMGDERVSDEQHLGMTPTALPWCQGCLMNIVIVHYTATSASARNNLLYFSRFAAGA